MDEATRGTNADDGSSASDVTLFRTLCHDLRQPLVVAMGYVSMLEDGTFGELPEEARGIMKTVAERLEALNTMVDRSLGDPLTGPA